MPTFRPWAQKSDLLNLKDGSAGPLRFGKSPENAGAPPD